MTTSILLRALPILAIILGASVLNAQAENLVSVDFKDPAKAESQFEVFENNGQVKFADGVMTLTELEEVDGYPSVFVPVNDDGAVPVTYSVTVAGGEGNTRLLCFYLRTSGDRMLYYRVDFLIEGREMMVSANRFEKNLAMASNPSATARGAFPAPLEGTRLSVTTKNREDGVALTVAIDGSEVLDWVDTDAERSLDGQYFGIAVSDNGAKDHGETGIFSLGISEVNVSRQK